ncbi:hypothetical protein F0160_22545 [Paraburkholderia sp. JPY303]|nr:hypothetical protein [Paraburkholderia atlantica]
MRPALILIGATVVLGACTTASHTYGPDGRPAYTLNCSGAQHTWGSCYEKAGELCGERGYDVLAGGAEGGAAMGGGSSAFFGTTTVTRSMLIACKRPS